MNDSILTDIIRANEALATAAKALADAIAAQQRLLEGLGLTAPPEPPLQSKYILLPDPPRAPKKWGEGLWLGKAAPVMWHMEGWGPDRPSSGQLGYLIVDDGSERPEGTRGQTRIVQDAEAP